MTPKFRHRTLACAGGVLAAGCTLAGMGASQANAVTERPGVVSGLAVETDDATGLALRVAPVRAGGRLEPALPAFWAS